MNSNSNGAKLPVTQLLPQAAVALRFIAGAVFTGFTRPQVDTFCVATTAITPLGIAVAGLDGAIIVLLVVRAYSPGGLARENRTGKEAEAEQPPVAAAAAGPADQAEQKGANEAGLEQSSKKDDCETAQDLLAALCALYFLQRRLNVLR